MSKLSSGSEINSAADDPSGLVISEQMRSQIGSIAQKIVNLDTLLDKNNTADSHLVEMEDALIEMREMAVAATSTGSVDDNMVSAYENALNDSASAFNKLADESVFGRQKLFDGSEGSVANIADLESFDLSDPEAAENAVSLIDEKLAEIQGIHGQLGARSAHELQAMRDNLAVTHSNLTAAESNIRDADIALMQSQFVSQKLRMQGATALLAQGHLLSKSVFGLLVGS